VDFKFPVTRLTRSWQVGVSFIAAKLGVCSLASRIGWLQSVMR